MSYDINFKNGKTMIFDKEQDRADYIFDKGYTQRGKALYYEVEDGKMKLVGIIEGLEG